MTTTKGVILQGLTGKLVEVETKRLPGLYRFVIVGLPDRALSEARERIAAGLISAGVQFPYGQLIVNLLPAYLAKHGTMLDLAICAGVILSENSDKFDHLDLEKTAFLGEVSLDGRIREPGAAVAGVLALSGLGVKKVVLPRVVYEKCSHLTNLELIPISSVLELSEYLRTGAVPFPQDRKKPLNVQESEPVELLQLATRPELARIVGIAASGRHNLLLDGWPGSGKTTVLRRFNQLLPPLTDSELAEVVQLHSLAGTDWDSRLPPQRAPHQSATDAALLGGGQDPTPGEISLAHNGALFLDEICEFSNFALEALRQPLVDKQISVGRARYRAVFPADFQLLATRNPCPCGWYGSETKVCHCPPATLKSYKLKLSGALLDRIEMKVNVAGQPRLKTANSSAPERQLKELRGRIAGSVARQAERYDAQDYNGRQPGQLDWPKLAYTRAAKVALARLYRLGQVTLRGAIKLALLARTIADFDDSAQVQDGHVFEAYSYNDWVPQ